MKRLVICCEPSLFYPDGFPEGAILLHDDPMAEEAARMIMRKPEITRLSVIGTPGDVERTLTNIARVLGKKYANCSRT